uniref:Uncharacterized protein n=1 Tax=Hyaloperonospora arabidopsidis (strain Emoy2) TaxID=559515 RepID=M4B2C6_HYAAE
MPDRYRAGKCSARTRASSSDGQAVIHRRNIAVFSAICFVLSGTAAAATAAKAASGIFRIRVVRLKMRVGCSRGGDIGCCCCINYPWRYTSAECSSVRVIGM